MPPPRVEATSTVVRPSSRASISRVGIVPGVTAQILGALGFIVPDALSGFTATQLTLGRYIAYGFLSLYLFLSSSRTGLPGLSLRAWWTALVFAATANVGYYFILVLGIQFVGAAVSVLIIGTLPVTVAFYGNWRRHEYPFSRLALPVALTLIGLVLINLPGPHGASMGGGRSGTLYLVGLLCTVTALALWTWFAVANAIFLERHTEVSATAWTSVIGVNTLILAVAATVLLATGYHFGMGPSAPPLPRREQDLLPFLVGSLILGCGASWVATSLWNRASILLPISVAGQLIVCEPLTVLLYVFLIHRRLPTPLEFLGITLTLGGVLLGLRATRDRNRVFDSDARHA
jgi:drug/metabolite transporter (DMT)-like permease